MTNDSVKHTENAELSREEMQPEEEALTVEIATEIRAGVRPAYYCAYRELAVSALA